MHASAYPTTGLTAMRRAKRRPSSTPDAEWPWPGRDSRAGEGFVHSDGRLLQSVTANPLRGSDSRCNSEGVERAAMGRLKNMIRLSKAEFAGGEVLSAFHFPRHFRRTGRLTGFAITSSTPPGANASFTGVWRWSGDLFPQNWTSVSRGSVRAVSAKFLTNRLCLLTAASFWSQARGLPQPRPPSVPLAFSALPAWRSRRGMQGSDICS
jgi:hypothetical protein